MNQWKESGNEFNICLFKLKSFTTPNEKNTLLDKVPNTSEQKAPAKLKPHTPPTPPTWLGDKETLTLEDLAATTMSPEEAEWAKPPQPTWTNPATPTKPDLSPKAPPPTPRPNTWTSPPTHKAPTYSSLPPPMYRVVAELIMNPGQTDKMPIILHLSIIHPSQIV